MPYINVELNYLTHPKTERLIAKLGFEAQIYPIRLWILTGKYHCSEGLLVDYNAEYLESKLLWKGEPGKLVQCLVPDFIIRQNNGFKVVDWLKNNGHLKYFKKRGRRNATIRWAKRATMPENKQETAKTGT